MSLEGIAPQNDPEINYSSISTTQGVGKRVRRIPSRYRDSDDEPQTKNKVENKLRKKIVVNKDNSLEIQAEKYKRMREINNKSSKRCLENKKNKDRKATL